MLMSESAQVNSLAIGPVIKKLTYFITSSDIQRSFDPKDSDHAHNAVHMRQLVGTLLKYNYINTFVPYLADSWKVSQDQKTWKFSLKKGFSCEDGTELNSFQYKEGLQLAFRNHAPSKTTPVFSLLKGWSEFLDAHASEITGIHTPDKHSLVFEFAEPPSGVEAYFSMPYFGFYCRSNFGKDGKWRDRDKIVSSGPYRLKIYDRDKEEIQIELRSDWPAFQVETPPELISIRVESRDFILKKYHPYSIVEASLGEQDVFHPDWLVRKGAMQISSNLILNHRAPFFADRRVRQRYAKLVRKKLQESRNKFQWAVVSPVFYPFSFKDISFLDDVGSFQKMSKINSGSNINVEEFLLSNERMTFIDNLLKDVNRELDIKPSYFPLYKEKLSLAELDKKRESDLDVYFIYVDKGGAADPWSIRMMFCSELGARFPDPEGKICTLTRKYEGRSLTPQEYYEYGKAFEIILAEDAVVVPLVHRGQNYLYSQDIDMSRLTPNMSITDFQSLRLKND
jgi:hypothetical protein